MTSITLMINTKNEIENLAGCIQSATGVDEILVGDMHSTDGTPELAAKLGAKVLEVSDFGYVEPARRQLIRYAHHPWVLMLDADERLAGGGVERLRELVGIHEDIIGWSLGCRTWFGLTPIVGSGWFGHTHLRFFRKEYVEFSSTIHTPPYMQPSKGKEATAEGVWFENFAYHTLDDFFEKCLRYGKYAGPRDKRPVIGSVIDGLWELVNRYDPDHDGAHSMALAWGAAMMRATAGMRDLQSNRYSAPTRKQFFDAIREFAEKLPNE